jgi:hypothetical protein
MAARPNSTSAALLRDLVRAACTSEDDDLGRMVGGYLAPRILQFHSPRRPLAARSRECGEGRVKPAVTGSGTGTPHAARRQMHGVGGIAQQRHAGGIGARLVSALRDPD